jgi:hypothetical protein
LRTSSDGSRSKAQAAEDFASSRWGAVSERFREMRRRRQKIHFFLLFTQKKKVIMIGELFGVCRTLIADLTRLGSFR